MQKKKSYNVAVIGVGVVGEEMLRCLSHRKFPVDKLKVLARSSRVIRVDNRDYQVEAISDKSFEGVDIALFAGTEGEKGAAVIYAPIAIKAGAVVIDNGADFRMEETVPLVVPEVNSSDVFHHKGIISNPNCSTIQLVAALWPIYKLSKIKRVIITTLQAASGAGKEAVIELWNQNKEILELHNNPIANEHLHIKTVPSALPKQIAFNVFPQIGSFKEFSFTTEEWKVVRESHKIMHDENIKISATCVRVPVSRGHSESVYIETERELTIKEIHKALENAPGIKLVDDPIAQKYPMPVDCAGLDDTFVGRIRKDPFEHKGLWLWIVSDNLLKGAALNAVQIAELLIKQ
ncbi:MAG: aspartate-semialdehyde dehydrogenase [Candidatus Omnitrophota bacterium]